MPLDKALEIPQPSRTDELNIFGIPVTIEIDEGSIVVTDYIVHMYGVGTSIKEAVEDYKISIKAYFEELQKEEDMLGDNLTQHLCYLRNIFTSIARQMQPPKAQLNVSIAL